MLLLASCTAAPEVSVSHLESETGSVVSVEWEAGSEVVGRVDAGDGNVTPAVRGEHQRHVLWGFPPDEVVALTVIEDDAPLTSLTIRTDAPPDEVPEVTVETGGWDGLVAVPYGRLDDDRAGVVVLDGQGRRVAWVRSNPLVTTAVWDGSALWHNVDSDAGELRRVPLDGEAPELLSAPDAHHEFVVGEPSAYLRRSTRDLDGETVIGDQIVSFEGEVLWDTFDTLPIERHEAWDALPEGADWTHANGLAWNDGTWIVSLYWLQTIVEVQDGAVVRTLEGDGDGEAFGPQHAAEPLGDGLLFFDNQLGTSRVVELGWDGALRWEWAPEDPVSTLVLGDVDRMADGRTLTAWGTDGRIIGLDGDDEAWRVRLEDGFFVGQPDWRAERYAR